MNICGGNVACTVCTYSMCAHQYLHAEARESNLAGRKKKEKETRVVEMDDVH